MKCWLVVLVASENDEWVRISSWLELQKMGVNNWTTTELIQSKSEFLRCTYIEWTTSTNEPSFIQMRRRRLWLFIFIFFKLFLLSTTSELFLTPSTHKISHIIPYECWLLVNFSHIVSFHIHLVYILRLQKLKNNWKTFSNFISHIFVNIKYESTSFKIELIKA